MKKLTLSVLALATVASITSCKKGEEDPSLSLTSRKSRFAGEWKMKSQSEEITTTTTKTNGIITDVSKTTSDGATYTETSSNTSTVSGSVASSEIVNGTLTESIYTILKDGTWSSKEIVKLTSGSSTFGGVMMPDTYNKITTTEENGTWQFTKKNKSIKEKNKESVIMSLISSKVTDIDTDSNGKVDTDIQTNTYGTNEKVSVWHLTQLKSKAMIVDAVIKNTFGGTYSNNGGTPDNYNAKTENGKLSMTFGQ